MKVKSLKNIFNFIDPLLIYIAVIYGLSRVYQSVFEVGSVWQIFWEKILATLGR